MLTSGQDNHIGRADLLVLALALALPLNAVGNPYIAAAARQSVQFIDNARAELAPGGWNGRLEFPGIYCVQFDKPDQAASVTTSLRLTAPSPWHALSSHRS